MYTDCEDDLPTFVPPPSRRVRSSASLPRPQRSLASDVVVHDQRGMRVYPPGFLRHMLASEIPRLMAGEGVLSTQGVAYALGRMHSISQAIDQIVGMIEATIEWEFGTRGAFLMEDATQTPEARHVSERYPVGEGWLRNTGGRRHDQDEEDDFGVC